MLGHRADMEDRVIFCITERWLLVPFPRWRRRGAPGRGGLPRRRMMPSRGVGAFALSGIVGRQVPIQIRRLAACSRFPPSSWRKSSVSPANWPTSFVVSVHWGKPNCRIGPPKRSAAGALAVEHGADLIVGHHPHVVQAPACIEGRPVFSRFGNHLFDQKYAETATASSPTADPTPARLLCGGLKHPHC